MPALLVLLAKNPLYKRKLNPDTGDYVGPDHKSQSHIADAVQIPIHGHTLLLG
jgi:hypothetical protein